MATPSSGQARALSHVAALAGPAQQIQVDKPTLFIVSDRTLRTVDITSPSTPRPAASFTFEAPIRTFVAADNLVYAFIDFWSFRV